MEKLKCVKGALLDCVKEQIEDLHSVDTHELGEVIDMIKDLEQTMYYHTIIEAMEEKTSDPEHHDHDMKHGKSCASRAAYMEAKEMHKDKAIKLKELERYTRELADDINEMIEDASLEEKQMLEKRMIALASKMSSLNNT